MSSLTELLDQLLRELAAAALEQLRLIIATIAEFVHDLAGLPDAYRSMSYEVQQ